MIQNIDLASLTIAFEHADKGFDTKLILHCFAINIGLTQIGNLDEIVPYDPIIHEDIESGIVPGENIVIIEIGFRKSLYEIVRRAKVKRSI